MTAMEIGDMAGLRALWDAWQATRAEYEKLATSNTGGLDTDEQFSHDVAYRRAQAKMLKARAAYVEALGL